MLLKFSNENNTISLCSKGKAELKDITNDLRTKLLNKNEMCTSRFCIEDNVYILKKDLFISLAKKETSPCIEALLIQHNKNHIIIVGDKSLVFYNGRHLTIENYDVKIDMKTLGEVVGIGQRKKVTKI